MKRLSFAIYSIIDKKINKREKKRKNNKFTMCEYGTDELQY